MKSATLYYTRGQCFGGSHILNCCLALVCYVMYTVSFVCTTAIVKPEGTLAEIPVQLSYVYFCTHNLFSQL